MLRSEAARYARWSAVLALLCSGLTAAVYLQRHWKGYIERKRAPAPAPLDVSRQSNGLSFKKVDQNRTVFEVQASRSTDFKGQDASLIEEVQIDLMSAEDAERLADHPEEAKARTTHVQTQDVKFDRTGGIARTDQPVTFAFPNGTGE